ncbi:MAG: transporter substrate-binding domain-containing protein [Syntrophobacteria bacterium]
MIGCIPTIGLKVNMVSQNHKMVIAKIAGIVTLLIITLLSVKALAQGDKAVPDKLLVAVVDAPPFYMKTTDGRWEGLSIELWQAVAQELGVEFELREYSFGQELDAVTRGEVDVILALAVTEQREIIMDLSHPFLRSGSAIAVLPGGATEHSWLRFAEHLVSLNLLPVIGLLILLSLTAGTIVWLFEARQNPEMFGGGTVRGVGHGIWWAIVTLTTVGYGDKAPKTFGGRMVALIWMLASIILIASFTAAITASFTVGELKGKVRGLSDLPGVRVGSLTQSESFDFLAKRGIAVLPFENSRDGLQAIVDKKIDAFVFNESVLKHLVRTEFPDRVHVLAGTFDHYYASMAVPSGSPLREPLNRALLKIITKDDWLRLVEFYLGPDR